MNARSDWSNDTLKVGDLVILHTQPPGYMRDMTEDKGMGIVLALDTPRGYVRTYDITVLTPSGLVMLHRQLIEKVINDL